MSQDDKIADVDVSALRLIYYPDPRLTEMCEPVQDPTSPAVRRLIKRLWELIAKHKGVGLAAPQIGMTARLFVTSPTFQSDDLHAYINPHIIFTEGSQDESEGCLSFPDISCPIRRANIVTIEAIGLDGRPIQETAEGLPARILQHECDHLDGRLLIDRMGSVARLTNRKALKQLEAEYAEV